MPARGTVLVADDDILILDFITEALSDEGYQVRCATNGAEAAAALLTNKLDLALIDLLFGGMSGLDVLRAVRAHGITIPIIIMTDNTTQAQSLEAQGADVCLLKPFDLDDLFACVAQHIRPQISLADPE
jgi:DNA-binding response OmpR family regulator